MKRNIFMSIMFFGVMGLSACEDVIDVDLEQGETLLVVDGRITDEIGIQHTITLSTTAPYFNNSQSPRVSNAVVLIEEFDENGVLLQIDSLLENPSKPGDYLTQTTVGIWNHTYVLKVRALGQEYSARSTMTRIPPIDSLRYEYKEAAGPFDAGYFVYYYGPETEGIGDNYLFIIYRNGVRYQDPNQIYFASDELVDGNYIGNVDITPEPFELGDTITCESYTISSDHYQFLVELSTQVNNGGIFASPPANVRTNIKNVNANGPKAVGYFGANAMQRKSVVIQ